MGKNKKLKKQKVIYYDDNSTICDMSSVSPKNNSQKNNRQVYKNSSTFKDKLNTYFASVKMMLLPMFVVLGVLLLLYLILMLLF